MQKCNTKKQSNTFISGIILAVLGASLFGLKSIFIKLAFEEGVDASTLLAWRMIIAFPLYSLILWWTLKQSPLIKQSIKIADFTMILVLGFLGYFLAAILDFEGLNYVSTQLERLTLFTYPVMVTVLNWLIFAEKITSRIGVSLIATYSGVVFLFYYESSAGNTEVLKGTFLVGLAAFSFSLYVILSQRYIKHLGSLIFTSMAMLSSTLFVLAYFFIQHDWSDLNISLTIGLYAMLLSVVCTLIPSFMISEAIFRIGSTRTSIIGTAGPVVTVMLAVMVLDEVFGWMHLVGMVLVISGVLIMSLKKT